MYERFYGFERRPFDLTPESFDLLKYLVWNRNRGFHTQSINSEGRSFGALRSGHDTAAARAARTVEVDLVAS